MARYKNLFISLILASLLCTHTPIGLSQSNGTLRGQVTLETSGKPLHDTTVTIIQLKRSTETDDNGAFEFKDVPPGTYDVMAHLDRVPDSVQSVVVAAGA